MSKDRFRDRVLALPQVSVLDPPYGPCEGGRHRGWTFTPCKKTARYRYEQLPEDREGGRSTSGNYCWSHLVHRGVIGTQSDQSRNAHVFYASKEN